MPRPFSPRSRRGFTLLECMISMAVLSVGMIGVLRMQLYGLYSDQGARANVRAQELARELANGLMRLDPLDTRLAPKFDAATAPSSFAKPLDASTASSWTVFGTGDSLSGVTPTANVERDPLDGSQPLYLRKWSVWQITSANAASGVKLVAVSVVYHEQRLSQERAVTVYAQVTNPGAAAVNAAAYR